MPHNITALILKGNYEKLRAETFDLFGKELGFNLTLFHIDHYQSACWQYELKTERHLETPFNNNFIFPTEMAIAEVVGKIAEDKQPVFALISTDYFGGIGEQFASVYQSNKNANMNVKTINQALAYLGVKKHGQFDEFDTVGLSKIRSQPDFFEKYVDLADKYGV